MTDFERYPEWVKDMRGTRSSSATTRAAARGRVHGLGPRPQARYTLHYDYSAAPTALSWKLVEGDIMRAIDGAYRFDPSATAPAAPTSPTTCRSSSSSPLPGFVKRRAEVRILNTVHHLKSRAEG